MFFLSKNSTRRFFSSSSASELNILPFSLPTQLNNMFLSLNKKILISLSSYFLGNLLQIISKILNFSCGSSTIDDNSNCFNLSKLRFLANFNTILFFRSMLSIFSISKFWMSNSSSLFTFSIIIFSLLDFSIQSLIVI